MAANKLFSIPESIELVLLELEFKDLVRIMYLSRTVHDTVKSTPKLQRNLFLRQALHTSPSKAGEPSVNPILTRIFDEFTSDTSTRVCEIVAPETLDYRNPANMFKGVIAPF